jgi:hypothetical protein
VNGFKYTKLNKEGIKEQNKIVIAENETQRTDILTNKKTQKEIPKISPVLGI